MLEAKKNQIGVLTESWVDLFSGDNAESFIGQQISIIKKHQHKIDLRDYHPYESLLVFIIDTLEKIGEKINYFNIEKDSIDINDEHKIILSIEEKIGMIQKRYKDIFFWFNHNLEKFKEYKYNNIYITADFCVKEINGKKYFLDSSYVLPEDFQRVKNKWEKIEQNLDEKAKQISNYTKVEVHRLITEKRVELISEKIAKQVKENEVNFEKKVRENEFKTVQIVAMFVSIATFVLGNVKIFENKNLWASLSVMFGFAASLLLFNAFFKWIIAENILINKSTTDIRKVSISFSDTVMYSSIVVMVLLSISLASYSYNLENTNQAEIIKRWIEIDKKKEGAIKAIKLKLDSLITMNKIKKSRLTTSNIQNSPMKN